MKKIAVVGPNGRLGSWLVMQGCIPLDVDVTQPISELIEAIDEIGPDVIINCAAYTKVDEAEKAENLAEAMSINLRGPGNIRRSFEGLFIHMSTGYVFDGENGPYSEHDSAQPINWYGWGKWGGEFSAKVRNPTLVVRTLELFGPHIDNDFVRFVRDVLTLNELIELPETLFLTPTYIPHLSEALLQAAERELTGTLHLAGTLTLSRYEWGKMIAEHFGFDVELIQPTTKVKGKAPRPLQCGLKVDKAIALELPIYSPLDGLVHLSEWENARERGES